MQIFSVNIGTITWKQKMETAYSIETSVPTYNISCQNTEDNLKNPCCDNLKT
jgi:hypothetical protein